AGTVLAEGLRVQWLVDALLLLARADEHTLQLRRRPVDLDDLALEAARRLRETTDLAIDATGISAGRVTGDAAALGQVVRNLTDNAAQHAHGCVRIGVSTRDASVEITVDDDGPGIPEADRDRVFDRFVRLDEARTRDDGGAGLGLAIVAELVRAHDGTVTLTTGDLGGLRASVTFPARDDDVAG
ncbi:MAG: sensor histidine kinase, partial [Jiangellaceae bacterium]